MTKDEAIQWMQLGARCEHRYFADGWDPYVCIAAREYGCLIAEVNEPMRQIMKRKYFALMYGGSL